jgi:hypothetical protein
MTSPNTRRAYVMNTHIKEDTTGMSSECNEVTYDS